MMGAGGYSAEAALDDEEDISRGDMFDHLSPRELSMARYQQNHEWMEEILSSPYRIGQIEVSDLGLGRKGELASLTEGIFEAQGADALVSGPKKPYTGHLDQGMAEEFRKRVEERNKTMQAEIDQMKAEHEKRLAKFKGNAAIKHAEHDLRAATQGTGTEFWRLEGRLEDDEEIGTQRTSKTLEEIVARVEELVGKQAVAVSEVHRVQDGGYQEPEPEPEIVQQPLQVPGGQAGLDMSRQPSQAGSLMIGDSDIDMGGTAAGLLDQMHTGFSSTSTPMNNFPTPQPNLSAIPSNAGTPANLNVPSPVPAQAPTSQPVASAQPDVQMADADVSIDNTAAPDGDKAVPATIGITTSPPAAAATSITTTTTTQPAAAAPTTASVPAAAAAAADTPSAALDNDGFSSLGDLDTAGDALASYGEGADDAGNMDPDDMGMEDMVEDSAFGDAFHGVEQAAAASDGNGAEGAEGAVSPPGM